jgi:SDR family mycofactocin-dependent oxidoreductase
MGRVQDKVILITGVARGQGRSHAVRLAEEGANIIGIDSLEDIPSVPYPMGSEGDLDETRDLISAAGGKHHLVKADVRDRQSISDAVRDGVELFGGALDGVVAQAGVMAVGNTDPASFNDTIDVNLVGVLNTVGAAYPHLKDGASIVITGSYAAFTSAMKADPNGGAGGLGYVASKRMLAAYTHDLALAVAPRRIRANAVHPTSVDTRMMRNDAIYRSFRPDLESPTFEDALPALPVLNLFPDPFIEVSDVSHAVVYLLSDESRAVTGTQMRVDLGAWIKLHDYQSP